MHLLVDVEKKTHSLKTFKPSFRFGVKSDDLSQVQKVSSNYAKVPETCHLGGGSLPAETRLELGKSSWADHVLSSNTCDCSPDYHTSLTGLREQEHVDILLAYPSMCSKRLISIKIISVSNSCHKTHKRGLENGSAVIG